MNRSQRREEKDARAAVQPNFPEWGLCGRPLLANGVEQCLVDADLPMSDEVEFVADRLFPIGHADEPRLHEGEIVPI